MDTGAFFFGLVSGALLVVTAGFLMSYAWLRPYLKSAREAHKSKTGLTADEKTLSEILQQREQSSQAWAGNDPWKHWTKRKPR